MAPIAYENLPIRHTDLNPEAEKEPFTKRGEAHIRSLPQ
jgi:hypothetical protein